MHDEKESLASDWFVRLFAAAVLAHIAGNRPFGLDALGISILALGLVAVQALLEPASRAVRVALASLVLVTVWFEAPSIGNHWLVAGFVSLALLASSMQQDWWTAFAPTGRGILLAFYSFSAFAKLNSGFFDPQASCALVFANRSLGSWGLPLLPESLGVAVAAATAIVELSVPVLLVIRRTRPLGVVLGFGFHFLLSLDLQQHFYDFTALLFAFFSLFVDDRHTSRWEAAVRRQRPLVLALAGFALVLTLASALPPTTLGIWLVTRGVFYVWIPIGVVLVIAVLRLPLQGTALRLRPSGAAGALIVALVIFNGLTPYLGLKTGYGYNMYANLRTADGQSNHYVIRRTASLVHVPLATIAETSDPQIARYRDGGYRIPERNLLHLLADRPDATVEYTVEGRVVRGTGAELGRRMPLLVEKFALFRSVDSQDPPRCQAKWLPAW